MDSILKYVGAKIKFYRKLNKLTIEEFSALINKSPASVSKYESGSISIDLETLYDIASALGIEIRQLVDYKKVKSEPVTIPGKLIGNQPFLYMYYYDGQRKKVVKSLIHLSTENSSSEGSIIEAKLYADIPSFDDFDSCKYLYSGTVKPFDLFTYFFLENQSNHLEKVNLVFLNPLGKSTDVIGLIFGIYHKPIAPVTFKVFISQNIVPDDCIPADKLHITKEDIRTMKLYNMWTLVN